MNVSISKKLATFRELCRLSKREDAAYAKAMLLGEGHPRYAAAVKECQQRLDTLNMAVDIAMTEFFPDITPGMIKDSMDARQRLFTAIHRSR